MRDRRTRGRPRRRRPHAGIGGRAYPSRPVGTRGLVATYGAALLVPVVLWAMGNPLLAGGIVAFVGVAYALIRVARRRVRNYRSALRIIGFVRDRLLNEEGT